MFIKVVVAAAILALATGQYNAGYVYHQGYGHIGHGAPAVVVQHHPIQYSGNNAHQQNYYTPPHYQFEYSVADSNTGDIKTQQEARQGDGASGGHSRQESDGSVDRTDDD